MSQALAKQVRFKTVSEVRTGAFDFQDVLSIGESLVNTATIEELSGDGRVTINNPLVNTAQLTMDDADGDSRTVAAGKALQFRLLFGTAGKVYRFRVTCDTDASPADTLIRLFEISIISDS